MLGDSWYSVTSALRRLGQLLELNSVDHTEHTPAMFGKPLAHNVLGLDSAQPQK